MYYIIYIVYLLYYLYRIYIILFISYIYYIIYIVYYYEFLGQNIKPLGVQIIRHVLVIVFIVIYCLLDLLLVSLIPLISYVNHLRAGVFVGVFVAYLVISFYSVINLVFNCKNSICFFSNANLCRFIFEYLAVNVLIIVYIGLAWISVWISV